MMFSYPSTSPPPSSVILLGLMEEYGTAIHKLAVVFSHCPGSRFGTEDTVITLSAQLWVEERIVLVCLHLLQK